MTCFNPRDAWRDLDALIPGETPKVRFSGKGDPDLKLPCGKCLGCRADQKQDWAIRLFHESQMCDRSSFLTLTYDAKHNPGCLYKPHVQQFIKRLRHHSNRRIKYFLTGELGEKTARPHYHAIIFGEDFLGGCYPYNDELWGHVALDRIWGQGIVSIGKCEPASCMYVAGYTAKKIDDPDTFNTMSKGSILGWRRRDGRLPPIGYTWCERYLDNIAATGNVIVQGRKYPIPKAYFNWFPRELAWAHGKRAERAPTWSPEELRNREINFKSKQQLRDETI